MAEKRIFIIILMVLLCGGMKMLVAAEGEKLLLSFEKEESFKLAGFKKEKDGRMTIRYNSYGTYHYMSKGDTTQGEWAISKNYKGKFDPYGKGFSESGLAAVQRSGRLLNGSGWMRRRKLTGDWSGYDRLRVDIKSTDSPARIRFRVADTHVIPVPERIYEIKPGKWVTLEFSLKEAADASRIDRKNLKQGEELFFRCQKSALYRARVLDLKDIHSIFINLLKCEAKTTILLDNMRLVQAGADVKGAHPLITDTSPWPKPEVLPAMTEPEPSAKVEQKLTNEKIEPGKPIVIDLSKVRKTGYGRMHNDRSAIAVIDSKRMALNISTGMNRAVFITQDGGVTWKGLDNSEKPSNLFRGGLMMVGACCTPTADGAELLIATLKHCSGGEEPSFVWFKKISVNGTAWKAEPTTVIDVDSWHCPEHAMDILRLENGRIWAAWSPSSRAGGVVARYSDDGGSTWRALDRDHLGKGGHGGKRPLLVPYGKGVACFFKQGWQEYFAWSFTDGKKWSKVSAPIPKLKGGPVSGVSLGGKELLVRIAYRKTSKLLHCLNGTWKEDTSVPFMPWRLSVSGKKVIAVGIKDGKVIMSVRDAQGKWSDIQECAEAEKGTVDLIVPRISPKHFIPIVWSTKVGKTINFLRVPLAAN